MEEASVPKYRRVDIYNCLYGQGSAERQQGKAFVFHFNIVSSAKKALSSTSWSHICTFLLCGREAFHAGSVQFSSVQLLCWLGMCNAILYKQMCVCVCMYMFPSSHHPSPNHHPLTLRNHTVQLFHVPSKSPIGCSSSE